MIRPDNPDDLFAGCKSGPHGRNAMTVLCMVRAMKGAPLWIEDQDEEIRMEGRHYLSWANDAGLLIVN